MTSRHSLYVGRLSSRVNKLDIEDQFDRYGKIRDIDFHKQKGFAFVQFKHSDDARRALHKMNGVKLYHKKIVVQWKSKIRL